jgi:hypothetical protein
MTGPDEFDPKVSLDIRLKDRLGLDDDEVVQVDFHTLRRVLDEVHAPMDSSDLQIIYGAKESTGPAGEYLPEDSSGGVLPSTEHTARVQVDPDDLDGTQLILVHELKHHSDHANGHKSMHRRPAYDKLYDVAPGNTRDTYAAALGLIGLPTMLKAGAILGATPDMSQQSHERLMGALDLALATNGVLAVGLVALNAVYVFDPSERRARKAALDSEVPNVLTIETAEKEINNLL